MDQTLGKDSDPDPVSGPLDKTRVWDVRPLRRLLPVFPSQPNSSSFSAQQGATSFFNVPPFGPFPSQVNPFYPFFAWSQRHPQQNPQIPFGVPSQNISFGYSNSVTAAVPITSFRTPPPSTFGVNSAQINGGTGTSRSSRSRVQSQSHSGIAEEDGYNDSRNQGAQFLSSFSFHVADVEDTSKSARQKNKSQKRTRGSRDINDTLPDVDVNSLVKNVLSSCNLMEFDTFRQTDGDRESVGYILLMFDLLRRKVSQIEDSREAMPGVPRRPDLRVGTILMNKGIRTNIKKRIGVVPGIEIGDIFFFRMELCLVGLHHPIMAGIGYMGLTVNQEEESVAVSIVSSGGYEDNVEDGDVLIYSGQGGNVNRKDKKVVDQKLERGNLALEKSLHRGNEVRVIRGVKDIATPTGKVYVYDGLYKIQESWMEKGKSGCNVFKYKLFRLPGQPEAFMTWKLIQQWKDGIPSRNGVILPDLTSGAENTPVTLVNDVDDEKGPAHFTYLPSLKYTKPVNSVEGSGGCNCHNGCLPGNQNCVCIQRNEGYLPYASHGVLVNQKSLIYECGPSCQCPPNCRNRVSQGGLRVHLEVYKTKDKGWGLRSWDPIRSGGFICEYAGEVIDISKIEEHGGENEDHYIFDATRTYRLMEPLPGASDGFPKIPFPLIITAKDAGNVARFMNHSCFPNVFWQPILHQTDKGYDLHIAFHAIKHIPPMTELTYDYGSILPDREERKRNCLCGSSKCRGYFY